MLNDYIDRKLSDNSTLFKMYMIFSYCCRMATCNSLYFNMTVPMKISITMPKFIKKSCGVQIIQDFLPENWKSEPIWFIGIAAWN